mmetsp:Transcript_148964/g.277710  ORF Transcript_148964/g.277710 Transcript_148964/m.277710 type:complete len:93 (-) Transcript_148964:20-298(-)
MHVRHASLSIVGLAARTELCVVSATCLTQKLEIDLAKLSVHVSGKCLVSVFRAQRRLEMDPSPQRMTLGFKKHAVRARFHKVSERRWHVRTS